MRFSYLSPRHTQTQKAQRNVMSDKIKYLPLLFLLFISCSREVQLERDEYRLHSLAFKGNKQISTEELEYLIPPTQKPNRRPFNLPITPYVGLYNLGKTFYDSNKIARRRDKWKAKLDSLPILGEFNADTEKKRARYQRKVNIYKDR